MFHMKQCDLIGVQSGRHTISRLLHAFLCAFQASDVFITTLSRAHWQKGQLRFLQLLSELLQKGDIVCHFLMCIMSLKLKSFRLSCISQRLQTLIKHLTCPSC